MASVCETNALGLASCYQKPPPLPSVIAEQYIKSYFQVGPDSLSFWPTDAMWWSLNGKHKIRNSGGVEMNDSNIY